MSKLSDAARLARTVRQLDPSQVAHRVRLRAQRSAIRTAPSIAAKYFRAPMPQQYGWPPNFSPLDEQTQQKWPSVELLREGKIELLGRQEDLENWSASSAPHLWRYHLHYWDWAWSLAAETNSVEARQIFANLWQSWTDSTIFGRSDAWSSYVVSLRAWSWCGQFSKLVEGTPLQEPFVVSLATHAKFLRAHLELDVGGNHLIKNLKALIGLAVFLRDDALLRSVIARLRKEVSKQILNDGGHFERAPAYHCQVLGDLMDIAGLLGDPAGRWLDPTIARMQRMLGLILLPSGSVPLLNDGFPIDDETLHALKPGPPAPSGITLLPDTGLAVLRRGRFHVLADVGVPCPPTLPAHAHADTLSFLLYHDTEMLVGEAFTSTYDPGARRQYERSTAAHSTIAIDDHDSSEVWGAFRAGRRAKPRILECADDAETSVLTASHDGYRWLPGAPVHQRTWQLTDKELIIKDTINGSGRHSVASRLVNVPERLTIEPEGVFRSRQNQMASGWEVTNEASLLALIATVPLPWCFTFKVKPPTVPG